MPSPALIVRHNIQDRRFEVGDSDALSVAEYRVASGALVFTHTYVPAHLRGQNIAEQLVRAGLAWAREQGAKVIPECSYVARFIERHSEYQDLLVPHSDREK